MEWLSGSVCCLYEVQYAFVLGEAADDVSGDGGSNGSVQATIQHPYAPRIARPLQLGHRCQQIEP